MATKKPAAKAAAPAKTEKTEKAKGKVVDADKAAKRAERLAKAKERAANRPAGQRPNSKTIDIITMENGSKVVNYGHSLRKVGTLVTSVAIDAEGNIISTSVTLVPGMKVKSKKEHGNLVPGVSGIGKGKKGEEDDEEDGDEE